MIKHLHSSLQGIIWMVIHCFMMAIITLASRKAAEGINPYMVCAMVHLFALIMSSSWLQRSGFTLPKTTRWKTYLLRGITGTSSYILFVYGLTQMTMADVSAIFFTSPLFGVIIALLCFKEQATFVRIFALAIGFVGALVVIQPGSVHFNAASLAVLTGAALYGGAHISVKMLTRTDSANTISLYTKLFMGAISMPIAFFYWQMPTNTQLLWAILVAVCWNIALYSMSKAYEYTEAVIVMPFQFTRLLFVVILGAIFLEEKTTMMTVIGSIIILVGAVFAMRGESKRLKGTHEAL